MKEKIEDKLQYIKDAGFELTDYETVDMLSTLIQEERKDAVEDFVKYIYSRPSNEWIFPSNMFYEYLKESEGKE